MVLPSLPNGSITPMSLRFHWTPIASVVPFTYRDGWTMLKLMEEFRKYITETFHPDLVRWVNEELDQIKKNFELLAGGLEGNQKAFFDRINELVAQINNRVGPTEIQRVLLTSDYVVNINDNDNWTDNHTIHLILTQDETGGHSVTLGDRVSMVPGGITSVMADPTPGSVTELLLTRITGSGVDPTGVERWEADKVGSRVPRDNNQIAIGKGALANVPADNTPHTLIAIGKNALGNATDIQTGIAIGNNAMSQGTTGLDNIAIGDDSLYSVQGTAPEYQQNDTSGTRNIAIGGNAGRSIVGGSYHVAIGRNAGQNIVAGKGLTALGGGAQSSVMPIGFSGKIENWAPIGGSNDIGLDITAIGYAALNRNSALDNTALGSRVLMYNTTGSSNCGSGTNALRMLGYDTWLDGGAWTSSVLSGTYVHADNSLTLNINNHGLQVGDTVLLRLTSGTSQTKHGDQAPAVVQLVNSANVFVVNHPISRNATGDATMYGFSRKSAAPATSNGNTATGTNTLPALKSGNGNSAFGHRAGERLVSGNYNTFLGSQAVMGKAGYDNSMEWATAVGYGALNVAASGARNTAIGGRAGRNFISGNDNIFLGYGAGSVISGTEGVMENGNNIACLGVNSGVTGDNQLQLGNYLQTTYAFGAIQNRSDERDKADIRDTVLGLDFIEKLRAVDFKWNYREGGEVGTRFHHGLIAQEVQEVIKETGVDFGGFQDHKVAGGADVLTIGYDELIAPLIRAVQELSSRVKELENKL